VPRLIVALLAALLTVSCDRTGSTVATATRTAQAGEASAAPVSVGTRDPARPWFSRTLVRDLTGDGVADSAVLTARGARPDSSTVLLTLYVDGRVAHEERWETGYELIDPPESVHTAANQEGYLRARFANVFLRLQLAPLDVSAMAVSQDTTQIRAQLDSIAPLPTQQLNLVYGYETSMSLIWDATSHRFVPIFICC
jgi:hypothetical protein